MLPDHFRLFAARPAPPGSLEAEMPSLFVAQPVNEAARRHLDVRISEDRVLRDWARHATSLGDADRQEILVGDRLRVLCLAEDSEPADFVKSLADLEVPLSSGNPFDAGTGQRRERRIAAERDAGDGERHFEMAKVERRVEAV